MHIKQTITEIETRTQESYLIYRKLKQDSTQGKLSVIDHHVYINDKHVITAPQRFVTKEEREANLDLWIFSKEAHLAEDLNYLKNIYKYERDKYKSLTYFLFFILLAILIGISLKYLDQI